MNKQKLIEKWESKTGAPAFEMREVTESASNDDMYTFGYGVARTEIVEDLKQLDEPQKPVVPKFVAEWFEENKDDLEFFIWELCVDSYGSTAEYGMLNWIQQSENKPIETLIRMQDGYEVEVPVWYVKIGKGYFSGFDETKVTYVIDDAPDALAKRIKYDSKEEAEMDALQIGGEVVPG